MQDGPILGYLLRDFQLGFKALKEAYPFVRRHRLWTGVLSYGWMSRFLLVIAFFVGLNFLAVLANWFGSLRMDNPIAYGASLMDLYGRFFEKGYHLLTLGGMKYLILILTQVLTFHVGRRMTEILKGETVDISLKAFMQAQTRVIKISIAAWATEMVVTLLVSIALGMMDAQWLKSPLNWVVQCFFLGAVVIDGYFESHNYSVKTSIYASRQMAGLALAIGIPTYMLMAVPLAGPVIAPFYASIAATLALFEMEAKGWIPLKLNI